VVVSVVVRTFGMLGSPGRVNVVVVVEIIKLGTVSVRIGTDSVGIGTDSVGIGTDSVGIGNDSVGIGNDSVWIVWNMLECRSGW
jgi:hypothetical protein